MRLIELEIHNIRGIRHLSLNTKGNNFVIYGPNGSGKSGIVDSIEFLLTGNISRLTGSGTSGITLNKHGCHIDCRPEESWVYAKFKIPESKELIELRRSITDNAKLECSEEITPQLKKIIDIAQRGHYVLTRRELLKYITSESRTRAEEIQDLLNIMEIENIRRSFVKTKNELDKKYKAAKLPLNEAEGAIKATLQSKVFREDIILKFININRSILGGEPISGISSSGLKLGISPPINENRDAVNIKLLEKDIESIKILQEGQRENPTSIYHLDQQLHAFTKLIKLNPELLRSLSSLELIELGLKLIDGTGSCPLCDKSWPPGKLIEYLNKRRSDANEAANIQARIGEISDNILKTINVLIPDIQNVIKAANCIEDLSDDVKNLESWLKDLKTYSEAVNNFLEKYTEDRFNPARINELFASEHVNKALDNIYTISKGLHKEATPEQNAWDVLTRLEENLKALEKAKSNLASIDLPYKRASILLDSYQHARDNILGKLYDEIEERFVGLYKEIHGLDEEDFKAVIEPSGAGLDFEVDFYGRGTNPPHALHSEGHQDSMGLCLYLALIERLNEGLIDLIILDDVMMSVDANHRRDVCRLFARHFPNYQFFITTHDKTWAYQMKSEGLIKPKGLIEFYNWHVETGPQVNYEANLWEQIDNDISKRDISAAAARLRRGSEQFFAIICEALKAPIICRLNGQWDLGELLPAAMGQYMRLVKMAKVSANSWGNKKRVAELNALDGKAGAIYSRTQAEQWAVNTNVHYNNWTNFSPDDFIPVLSAFKDLFNLFVCESCGGIIYASMIDRKANQVRCNCLNVNWNLIEKGKK